MPGTALMHRIVVLVFAVLAAVFRAGCRRGRHPACWVCCVVGLVVTCALHCGVLCLQLYCAWRHERCVWRRLAGALTSAFWDGGACDAGCSIEMGSNTAEDSREQGAAHVLKCINNWV